MTTEPTVANQHLQANRLRKAYAFATTLHQHGIPANDVHLIPADKWNELARALSINPPGSQATLDLIHQSMVAMETIEWMIRHDAGLDAILAAEASFARAFVPGVAG